MGARLEEVEERFSARRGERQARRLPYPGWGGDPRYAKLGVKHETAVGGQVLEPVGTQAVAEPEQGPAQGAVGEVRLREPGHGGAVYVPVL